MGQVACPCPWRIHLTHLWLLVMRYAKYTNAFKYLMNLIRKFRFIECGESDFYDSPNQVQPV
jgi:hypothetical protein